jgi:putative toxin-antitoxin system antitoxin component (TIGR02293 family)
MHPSTHLTQPAADLEDSLDSPRFNEMDMLNHLRTETKTEEYLNRIKSISRVNDKTISGWLNITEKTLRTYKQANTSVRDNIKEHILYLLRLMILGNGVFGSGEEFEKWLNTPNFIFNNDRPANFLNTITGIRFVIDRLTAMEFGDNV